MIRIENLRSRQLTIENLSIEPGITSLIGKNGSGKTTLLKLCTGITLPESGSILIGGVPPRKTEIGWVNEFPDRNFLFDNPEDEIASPLRFQHIPSDEITRRLGEIRQRFDLNRLPNRSLRELSGGEKILVALAAAMVPNPHVLILDECDSHLDARSMRAIDLILCESHIPFILRSTQDMETAAESDHVIYLENNTVKYYGTPEEVFSGLQETAFYPMSWRCQA